MTKPDQSKEAQEERAGQVERVIVWYYRNSGVKMSKFQSFRVKLWYFFMTGKWMKHRIHSI
jgi:hypothetical protein